MTDPRDPAVAQVLARLAELAPNHRARAELLAPLVLASPYLGRFLIAHPEALAELEAAPVVRDRAAIAARLAAEAPLSEPEASFAEKLGVARQRALLGLAAHELVSGDPLATAAGLSALAEAAIEHALAFATAQVQSRHGRPLTQDGAPCGAVVIAMGALGGGELDFAASVDLLYAYATDQGRTDGARGLGTPVDLHVYHARLFAKLTQLLTEPGEAGGALRVDLDLRPEGRTGPLCNSAEALERYYESFGHDAERIAWIKARAVAGDLALGERIIASLEPFVFRKHLDYAFAEDLRAMKRRLDQASARLGHKVGFNVKLGRGGLRELDFVVRALQLAWGGRLPDLRTRDTRTALQRLALAGLVDQSEADGLASAHRFLLRIEHLLQLEEDRQTHVLSADPAQRRRVAERMVGGDGDPLPRFEEALAEHRKRVRAAFEAVVAGADQERAAGEEREPRVVALDAPGTSFGLTVEEHLGAALDPDADAGLRDQALLALGFVRPEAARNRIDVLARRPDSPFHPRHAGGGGGGALATLGAKILFSASQTPDPDQALSHVDALLRAIRHRHAALEQLDRDPRRLTALVNLFGTSHFLSRLLVRSPGLLDRLVLDGKEPVTRTRHDMARLLAAELELVLSAGQGGANGQGGAPIEDFLVAARRFQTAEILRIGFFDLAGLVADPSEQLSDLAEVIVLGLADAVRRELAAKSERELAEVSPLAVVALGAFARRELGYHSELELLFLVADDADTAIALRMSRAIVTALSVSSVEGSLYRLDSRPRPTGTQGPLSVTASRWREHHLARPGGAEPEAWELATLVHARVLGPARPELQALVGELADFASDALTRHPDAEPLTALPGLARQGRVADEDVRALDEAHRFLRRLDNRLALVQEVGADSLTLLAAAPAAWSASDRDHLRRLALRMGYGGASARGGDDAAVALYKDVHRHRQVVAEVTARLAALVRAGTAPSQARGK